MPFGKLGYIVERTPCANNCGLNIIPNRVVLVSDQGSQGSQRTPKFKVSRRDTFQSSLK
jgi:hypothetical protein